MASTKTVSVGKVPGKVFELPYKKNKSVEAYFDDIEVTDLSSVEIQVNGVASDVDHSVEPDDLILAVSQVKGN